MAAAIQWKDMTHTAAQIDSAVDDANTHIADSGIHMTAAEKTKLASLENYDDTALRQAVAEKAGLGDIFGNGIRLQGSSEEHFDMNDLIFGGNYHILTAGDMQYIDNKPDDPDILNNRSKILVFQFSGSNADNMRLVQIWFPNRTAVTAGSGVMYVRFRSSAWTNWFRVDGTELFPVTAVREEREDA